MMSRLSLVLMLWALSSGAALADSREFALFQRLCVETHADPAAALAAAKAEGFVEPMAAMTKDLASVELDDPKSRAKLVDDGLLMLVVGHKPFPAGPGLTMAGCGLVILPANSPAEDALTAWAGVSPIQGDDGQPFFLFSGDQAHRKSALNITPDDMAALAKAHDLQIAGASHKPDSTVLIYGIVQP